MAGKNVDLNNGGTYVECTCGATMAGPPEVVTALYERHRQKCDGASFFKEMKWALLAMTILLGIALVVSAFKGNINW